MIRIASPLVFFGIGLVLIAWAFLGTISRPTVVQSADTGGNQAAQEGAFYDNGWVVANYGNAFVMDTYLRYQELLGEPICGFDGQCQSFRLGRLCYRPGNPEDWKIEFANLGLMDLQVQGYTPKPGSAPHPALRDWLIAQLDAGLDVPRVVGRVISDPQCEPKTQICRQWTDKQLFIFDQKALTWDQVQRAPLGLWLTYTKTRPSIANDEKRSSTPELLPLLAGAALTVVGLASLQRSSHSGGSLPV